MKNPRTKKTEKEIQKERGVTIQEFKAWLQGITAFQDADWAPNKDQWLKIKKKIDDLIDDHLSGNFKPNHPIPTTYKNTPNERRIELLPEHIMDDNYSEQPLPQPRPAVRPTSTSLMSSGVTNVSSKSMTNPDGTIIPSGLPTQKTLDNQEPLTPSKFV